MHTACDCSCKGSESGKAEAVTAEVGGFEFAQPLTEILGVGPPSFWHEEVLHPRLEMVRVLCLLCPSLPGAIPSVRDG